MRIDLWLPTPNPLCSAEYLAAVGRHCEARGIDGIWVGEHVVLFDEYRSSYPYAGDGRLPIGGKVGLLEPFTTLSFLAAHTTTVRLGTAMVLLPQRNPVYTAKEVATLDWLSAGRVDLGIGVGWLREEFDALQVPFERRGARTDEYVEVLKTLWCEDESSFAGTFYDLPPSAMFPKPVQDPHPPLHIGGESDAALRRAARVGQGWHTFNRGPADLAAPLTRLHELLAEHGRRRSDLHVTVCPYFQPVDAAPSPPTPRRAPTAWPCCSWPPTPRPCRPRSTPSPPSSTGRAAPESHGCSFGARRGHLGQRWGVPAMREVEDSVRSGRGRLSAIHGQGGPEGMEPEHTPVAQAQRLLAIAGALSDSAQRMAAELEQLAPAAREAVLAAVTTQLGEMVQLWADLVRSGATAGATPGRRDHLAAVDGPEPAAAGEAGAEAPASPYRRQTPQPQAAGTDPEALTRDELTGVLNRKAGFASLGREIDRCRQTGARFILGYLNVDSLSATNERHGPRAGDELLRKVTAALRATLRSYDVILRLGGDEFLFSLPGADMATAEQRLKEFRVILAEEAPGASASVGFAELRRGDSLDDLVARADSALIQSRRPRWTR